jgi:hypothetical protein
MYESRTVQNLKPVILIRQDEAVFNENVTNTMQLVGPNGERPLLSKIISLG